MKDVMSLGAAIAAALERSEFNKVAHPTKPDFVGERTIHQLRISPSLNVEQILLTYNDCEYSIMVEKWADALPPKRQ